MPCDPCASAAGLSDRRATLTFVNQLRFGGSLGIYTVSVAPESVSIIKGMGTHYLQLQLEIGVPQVTEEAGRLLCLETVLYTPDGGGPHVPLGFRDISVPFKPDGEMRRLTVQYLITNAQLLAIEQRRNGDLRLELEVNGTLPQSASGFPGSTQVTEHFSIAESRWRQQLAGLGRTAGAEMLIPFPEGDEPRQAVAGFLREAQSRLGGGETDGAMLQVRKALETIRNTGCWSWPASKKDKGEITAGERWALIRSALEDQASGAMHVDVGTKDYTYARAEVEALIAMTAALSSVMP